MSARRPNAFTLLELALVLAVLGVLVSLTAPGYQHLLIVSRGDEIETGKAHDHADVKARLSLRRHRVRPRVMDGSNLKCHKCNEGKARPAGLEPATAGLESVVPATSAGASTSPVPTAPP